MKTKNKNNNEIINKCIMDYNLKHFEKDDSEDLSEIHKIGSFVFLTGFFNGVFLLTTFLVILNFIFLNDSISIRNIFFTCFLIIIDYFCIKSLMIFFRTFKFFRRSSILKKWGKF
jgi:hypothetical protein